MAYIWTLTDVSADAAPLDMPVAENTAADYDTALAATITATLQSAAAAGTEVAHFTMWDGDARDEAGCIQIRRADLRDGRRLQSTIEQTED